MKRKKSVIPGFGLSFGIVMAILGLIVIIPLCSLVFFSLKLSPHDFLVTVTRPRVLASYKVSILTHLFYFKRLSNFLIGRGRGID